MRPGLPGQGLTQLKTAQTAAAAMAPKIQGTLVLDRALAGLDLDFMILVSSIAVFTGGGPGPDRLLRGERIPGCLCASSARGSRPDRGDQFWRVAVGRLERGAEGFSAGDP